MNAEKVLITGGAGFLGRYLAARFAAAGWQVTVLDDLSCVNSTMDAPPLQHPSIRRIRDTIYNRPLIEQLVDEHETIVHFASVVGVEETIANPVTTTRNLLGTLHMVDALTPRHTVLFGSSADVYGMHSALYDRPMREDDQVLFEHAGVNRWVYPKVKALEENLVQHSAATSIIVRIFNCYGYGMDYPIGKRVIPQFIERILSRQPLQVSGDGQQIRAFCYFEDTLNGIELALRYGRAHPAPFSQTFNIGNPASISVGRLAELMVELAQEEGLLDAPLPIDYEAELYSQPFHDGWHRVPDIERAQSLLGFEPTIALRDGMRRMLRRYQTERASMAMPLLAHLVA